MLFYGRSEERAHSLVAALKSLPLSRFTTGHRYKYLVIVNMTQEELINGGLADGSLNFDFSFLLVLSEFTTKYHTIVTVQKSLSLSLVVVPVSIINFIGGTVPHFPLASSFSVLELTLVNFATHKVAHFTLAVLSVLDPTSFVRVTVEVNYFALAIFAEVFVLPKVHVTVGVQQHANGGAAIITELAKIHCTVGQQEHAFARQLVVLEKALINHAVLKTHLAVITDVFSPLTCKGRAILPRHRALAVSPARSETSVVLNTVLVKSINTWHGLLVED